MNKFIMLCGPAGVGKSTFIEKLKIEKLKDEEVIVLSSDAIRAELLGSEKDQSNNALVFNTMNKRLRASLEAGKTVIYDATNLLMKRRKALLDELKKFNCEKEIYVLLAHPEVIYERDKNRSRTVGAKVIDKHIKQFQCPQYFEGWDSIYIINTEPDFNGWLYRYVLLSDTKIPHDNPNHSLNIFDHLKKAEDLARLYYPEDGDFIWAAGFHDIGKPFCKTWFNNRGERDTVAHYYGHENAGAYFFLLIMAPFKIQPLKPGVLRIAGIINYHMEPYKRKEAYPHFEAILDPQLAQDIKNIHKIDREAH